MIPKIIHQTSNSISTEELRLARRMRRLLPDWEYRFWTDEQNESLVAEHFPQFLPQYCKIARGVVKADIARYMYMSAFGGFYFDTDYKLLRPIHGESLAQSCILPICRDAGNSVRLGNAILASEPGHPFWQSFLQHLFDIPGLTDVAESKIEDVTGPDGLTAFYLANRLAYPDVTTPKRSVYHPPHRYRGFMSVRGADTLGVHLSWGSWRTKNPLAKAFRWSRRKVTSL